MAPADQRAQTFLFARTSSAWDDPGNAPCNATAASRRSPTDCIDHDPQSGGSTITIATFTADDVLGAAAGSMTTCTHRAGNQVRIMMSVRRRRACSAHACVRFARVGDDNQRRIRDGKIFAVVTFGDHHSDFVAAFPVCATESVAASARYRLPMFCSVRPPDSKIFFQPVICRWARQRALSARLPVRRDCCSNDIAVIVETPCWKVMQTAEAAPQLALKASGVFIIFNMIAV
jgi:hypothetical protein